METFAGGGNGYTYGIYSGDGTLSTNTNFNYPSCLYAFQGLVWITDTINGRVRTIDTSNGIVSTTAGGYLPYADGVQATSSQLISPTGVYVDATGAWIGTSTYVRKIGIIINKVWVLGDPHFSSFSGGQFEVLGEHGKIYNIISTQDFQWNVEFINRRNSRKGTYIGSCGFIVFNSTVIIHQNGGCYVNGKALVTFHKMFFDSNHKYWIISYGRHSYALHLPCYYLYIIRTVKNTNVQLTTQHRRLTIKRYHLNIIIRRHQHNCVTHGILGQTSHFHYPVTSAGLNGEGVVQGQLCDYIVKSLLSYDSPFSLYSMV
eukprot:NODE_3524_length_1335_cov_16.510726_g3080_i0.p1 GENE.NODE_3524_length_1335_cov_16.510726_g3080_i0~~NODE_3524_length_1335_cov_16.510726_g3080_i0.p1  ORF type:complete len:369 (-),score=46.00 NODE_3524_length_1335_cov_16.510726_g3080_i0:228-1175(-)